MMQICGPGGFAILVSRSKNFKQAAINMRSAGTLRLAPSGRDGKDPRDRASSDNFK